MFRERIVLTDQLTDPFEPRLGCYVHIPFCASRCDYCAFATWTDRHALRSAYVDACIAQLAAERSSPIWESAWPIGSVYLGGGTPSQLDEADLERLVESIDAADLAEVTVEANPEDVSPAWAGAAKRSGATRISLGVQSLDPIVLAGLGRSHEPAAVPRAVEALAGAGIVHYSVDLIYGGAGETDASWAATLAGVLDLDPAPEHVSAYALTVEPGTPLATDPHRHPDDDVQARRYAMCDDALSAAGLDWYELSNWARPGAESRHNCNYWVHGDYLAIGAAAHGHRSGRRWWNLRTPERFMAAIAEARSPIAVSEELTPDEQEVEALQLSLRTRRGVPLAALPVGDDPALDGLVEVSAGSQREGEWAVLTRRGRLLANEVALRLRPAAAPAPAPPPPPPPPPPGYGDPPRSAIELSQRSQIN